MLNLWTKLTGSKVGIALGGIVIFLTGLLAFFIPQNIRMKRRSKAVRKDTRAQVKLDKKDQEKNDEDAIKDFASKFGPK